MKCCILSQRKYLQRVCNIRRNPSKESLCWPDGWTVYFFRVCLLGERAWYSYPALTAPKSSNPALRPPLFHEHEPQRHAASTISHLAQGCNTSNSNPCMFYRAVSPVIPLCFLLCAFPLVWSWATEANLTLPNTSFSPETRMKTEHRMQ